jgi:hypothetical protein
MRNSPLQRITASILTKRRMEKKLSQKANAREVRPFPGEGEFKPRNPTGGIKAPNHLGEGI